MSLALGQLLFAKKIRQAQITKISPAAKEMENITTDSSIQSTRDGECRESNEAETKQENTPLLQCIFVVI